MEAAAETNGQQSVPTTSGTQILLEPHDQGDWLIQRGKAWRLGPLDTPKAGVIRYREVERG